MGVCFFWSPHPSDDQWASLAPDSTWKQALIVVRGSSQIIDVYMA